MHMYAILATISIYMRVLLFFWNCTAFLQSLIYTSIFFYELFCTGVLEFVYMAYLILHFV